MQEQQETIAQLQAKVKTLEDQQSTAITTLASVQAAVAASEAALAVSEKKQTRQLQDEVSKLNSKFNSKTAELSGQIGAMGRMQQTLADVVKDVRDLRQLK